MLATVENNKTYSFNSKGGFFREVSGNMKLNEEHNIGVSTSGKSDNVLIEYLGCSVKIVEPTPYFQLRGEKPSTVITWRVNYFVWSRSKGTWGSRRQYQELDTWFVDKIIGKETRNRLERELLSEMRDKLNEGLTALREYVAKDYARYTAEDKCEQCGSHISEAHFPVCSLSDGYNVND